VLLKIRHFRNVSEALKAVQDFKLSGTTQLGTEYCTSELNVQV
jgi:hypothetical protein